MKKRVLSLIVGALVCASISTTAFASTKDNKEVAKNGKYMSAQESKISKNFLAKHPDLIERHNKLKNDTDVKKINSLLMVSNPGGPARPLSSYDMYFVAKTYNTSTKNVGSYEIIRNQTTTNYDFSGTIYVATYEDGYGDEQTSFNGATLGTKCDIITLDYDGDKVVDGFINIWKLDNVTSGKFTSTSVSYSANSSGKWPAITAEINIR